MGNRFNNNGVVTDDDAERMARHWTETGVDHSGLAADLTSVLRGNWKGFADIERTRESNSDLVQDACRMAG